MIQTAVDWIQFVGAWLLFGGPLYQAALELSQENDLRDKLGAARLREPDHVSAWWWLVPPVHYVLQRRRSRRFREHVMSTLDPDLLEDLVRYLNKASGWLLVGTGGLLIAVGETGQLAEQLEWSPVTYGVLSAVLAVATAGLVAARMSRSIDMVRTSRSQGSREP